MEPYHSQQLAPPGVVSFAAPGKSAVLVADTRLHRRRWWRRFADALHIAVPVDVAWARDDESLEEAADVAMAAVRTRRHEVVALLLGPAVNSPKLAAAVSAAASGGTPVVYVDRLQSAVEDNVHSVSSLGHGGARPRLAAVAAAARDRAPEGQVRLLSRGRCGQRERALLAEAARALERIGMEVNDRAATSFVVAPSAADLLPEDQGACCVFSDGLETASLGSVASLPENAAAAVLCVLLPQLPRSATVETLVVPDNKSKPLEKHLVRFMRPVQSSNAPAAALFLGATGRSATMTPLPPGTPTIFLGSDHLGVYSEGDAKDRSIAAVGHLRAQVPCRGLNPLPGSVCLFFYDCGEDEAEPHFSAFDAEARHVVEYVQSQAAADGVPPAFQDDFFVPVTYLLNAAEGPLYEDFVRHAEAAERDVRARPPRALFRQYVEPGVLHTHASLHARSFVNGPTPEATALRVAAHAAMLQIKA